MIESERLAEIDGEFELAQYLEVVRRRRWTILCTLIVVLAAGAAATKLMKPIYQAKAKLLVRAIAPQVDAVNTENPLVDLLAMAEPETVETQMEVLQSHPFLDEVFDAAGAPTGVRAPQVWVDHIRDTNVIEVTVESPDRGLAARVADAMLDHYLEYSRSVSLQEITHAREFVQRREQQAQRALQHDEDALLDFRRANRVTQLMAEQQSRAQDLTSLESRSHEVRDNIARVQAEIGELQQQFAGQSRERVVATGQVNPRVAVLQGRLAEATVEREVLLKTYRPGHLKVRTADATIASLKAQLAVEPPEILIPLHVPNERYDKLRELLDSAQTERQGLVGEQAQIEPQLERERQRMNELGPWELRLARLQRNREQAEKSCLSLADKLEDLQIRENARRSTARVIERAVLAPSPVRPRWSLNLAIALILGLLMGGALAFLREILDDRINSPEEVERLLGLPVLGHIPAIAGDQHLIDALPPHAPVVERYRSLRSSISFMSVDAPLTAFAVTSAVAGEGKTTTVLNLALAMAMDGRQVILIDTDLRRPRLHQLLELPASPGLTEVLMGECSLDEALQTYHDPHGHTPSLRVLTSGAIPPNPAEMLNTTAMESVIRQVRERANVVIFDTPPCLPVTDPQVLGARLDGVLLVAESGWARKTELRRACELLEKAHIRLLGVVLNKVSFQQGGYYARSTYYRSDVALQGSSGNGGNGHHGSGGERTRGRGGEGARGQRDNGKPVLSEPSPRLLAPSPSRSAPRRVGSRSEPLPESDGPRSRGGKGA